jgi:4-amino-4-deoxy-L-arabinose transferase-like glycosyltransferase
MRRREVQVVVALTALAATLRFATLGARGFWIDEAHTVDLVRRDLFGMLSEGAGRGEPPLYFVLAWCWANVFGTGEAALRSLPALFGVATVPVAYLAARELVSRRAATIAAALTAVSPLLIWHAQDARPYALVVLLGGLSFLFFARALRNPGARPLLLWALTSALAMSAHYVAVLLVAAEALWLLAAAPAGRRATTAAVGAVALAGAALVPLMLAIRPTQATSWRHNIESTALATRVLRAPAEYLVGYQPPLQRTSAIAAAVLVAVAIALLLARASARGRRGAAIAAAVGAAGFAAPILFALGGLDFFLTRYVVVAWVPLAVVAAAGFAAARAGAVAAAALGLLGVAVVVSTADVPKFERDDWRGAARALGETASPRAIVLTPSLGHWPFDVYRPLARAIRTPSVSVAEIDLIGLAPPVRSAGRSPRPPRPRPPAPPPGFDLVESRHARYFTLIRFRAPRPVTVTARSLAAMKLDSQGAALRLERPA